MMLLSSQYHPSWVNRGSTICSTRGFTGKGHQRRTATTEVLSPAAAQHSCSAWNYCRYEEPQVNRFRRIFKKEEVRRFGGRTLRHFRLFKTCSPGLCTVHAVRDGIKAALTLSCLPAFSLQQWALGGDSELRGRERWTAACKAYHLGLLMGLWNLIMLNNVSLFSLTNNMTCSYDFGH